MTWRRSSFCSTDHVTEQCVEVAHRPDGWVFVRDSKDLDAPTLVFTDDEWDAFILGAKAGEFDRPAPPVGGLRAGSDHDPSAASRRPPVITGRAVQSSGGTS